MPQGILRGNTAHSIYLPCSRFSPKSSVNEMLEQGEQASLEFVLRQNPLAVLQCLPQTAVGAYFPGSTRSWRCTRCQKFALDHFHPRPRPQCGMGPFRKSSGALSRRAPLGSTRPVLRGRGPPPWRAQQTESRQGRNMTANQESMPCSNTIALSLFGSCNPRRNETRRFVNDSGTCTSYGRLPRRQHEKSGICSRVIFFPNLI